MVKDEMTGRGHWQMPVRPLAFRLFKNDGIVHMQFAK